MLPRALKQACQQLGLDQSVFFSILARGWQLIIGPITIVLIVKFFQPAQQGFYYIFSSIIALQLFFEMGLSFVITQYTSHAFAGLRWGKQGVMIGEKNAVAHFDIFMGKAVRWYLMVALLFIAVVLPAGYGFLLLKADSALPFSWKLPWCLLVIFSGLNLLVSPFFAMLEGGGEITAVYKIRWLQNLIGSLASWTALCLGGGLYMASINMLCAMIISFLWLGSKKGQLLFGAIKSALLPATAIDVSFSWRQEIWPMQWKVALSWMSGYFISQLYIPIIFYYQGAISSGQIGMALAIASVIGMVAMAWITTKMPTLGTLAARKAWPEFDALFFRSFYQSVFVLVIIIGVIMTGIAAIQGYPIAARIIPVTQMGLLLLNVLLIHLIGCYAQYLRAHKQDPFVWLSLVGAVLMTGTLIVTGKYYGTQGVIIGALVINVLYGLPSAVWLWRKLRRQWHL